MFENKTAKELEERSQALAQQAEGIEDPEQLKEIEDEMRSIVSELEARKEAAKEQRKAAEEVAGGAGEVIAKPEKEERTMDLKEIRKSEAYVNAFAEYIKTGDDTECRALLSTNATDGVVPVPEIVEDRVRTAWERLDIMRLVRKTYVRGNLSVGFELSATDAVVHAEGTPAPAEETLTLGVIQMVPQSIKKWISVSDEVLDLKGEEFLDYIYDELTYRIAKKAQELLVAMIVAAPQTATDSAVSVNAVAGAPDLGIVAQLIANLSDEAREPVIVMNKLTYANFMAARAAGNFAADPFYGLPVYFDSTLPAYAAAANGADWLIVGDFGVGAHANFPAGQQITIKYDDLSLAEQDLVKIVGRMFVALGLVGDKAFATATKASA